MKKTKTNKTNKGHMIVGTSNIKSSCVTRKIEQPISGVWGVYRAY